MNPDETRAEVEALCADLTLQLEAQGWSSVSIRPIGRFIVVSATDPNGSSHGGARTNGQSLVDFLLSLGARVSFNAAAAPEIDLDHIQPYDAMGGRMPGLAEAIASLADLPAASEPENNPAAENDKAGNADHGEKLKDDAASSVSVSQEAPSQIADGLNTNTDQGESGEPIPDALADTLARLVAPDADAEAKKAALMKRLIDLEGLIRLRAHSPADWAEYEQLTKYASWFK